MCGIFFCLYNDSECDQKKLAQALVGSVSPLIKRRGPDCLRCHDKLVNNEFKLKFIGSVLHLRGSLTLQPLVDTQGNLLVWNGEVFGGIEVPDQWNDTSVLFNLLNKCQGKESVSHILQTMSSVHGPWSFMYYQKYENKLWFGRDYFGRRSLVWHLPNDSVPILAVSSVAQRSRVDEDRHWVWQEVPANGIYCLELNPDQNDLNFVVDSFSLNSFKLKKYVWGASCTELYKSMPIPVLLFNKQLPAELDLKTLDRHYDNMGLTIQKDLSGEHVLSSKYTNCDSSRSAARLSLESSTNLTQVSSGSVSNSVTEGLALEMLCCSEDNVQSLQNLCKRVLSSIDGVNNDGITSNKEKLHHLPKLFIDILGEAVRKRVFNLPRNKTVENREGSIYAHQVDGSRVGVLFSGGIDSIVLAALADRFVPNNEAIDLINVAFEQKQPKSNPTNKRKPRLDNNTEKPSSFDVPDRKTGKAGLLELANINPNRQWNFIEVNVVLEDLQKARSDHITHLVSPLNSVLDDSIGCALWFAARGSGFLRCPSCVSGDGTKVCAHPMGYTSTAKVLLVGMGADEQLGGYARHRTKFNQHSWLGLVNEMEMEVNRISERNLGRDDRCISDHGREARFPFLDEQVVTFLSRLPVYLKADLRLPRGTGEKLLLRQSAKLLGLTSSAVLPKRAIQFGSRIAKLESSNEKGSDTCTRLKQQ